jgi:virginiamycin A acetyltransferase
MPGITIGDGAVIAARSVVSQNVPPYAIFGGNPAQLIKFRFAPEITSELLKIQWWDWDLDKIRRYHTVLMGCDLSALKSLSN